MLAEHHEHEIASLAERYGTPRRVGVMLGGAAFDPLNRADRYGEVCMVIRRPNGRLVTAIKTFYPRGAYRLLTGGIGLGEPVEQALWREVAEETGLDVRIAGFLALIEYRFATPHARVFLERHASADFVTFAFLLDELGGTLAMHDPDEDHESFCEVEPAQLPVLANRLAHVPGTFSERIGGSWRDWGSFRAVVHRVVAEHLAHP